MSNLKILSPDNFLLNHLKVIGVSHDRHSEHGSGLLLDGSKGNEMNIRILGNPQ